MLNVGERAPDFELPCVTGEVVKLSDFLGKKVILCFLKETLNDMWDLNSYAFLDWSYQEFQQYDLIPICIFPGSKKKIPTFYDMVPILAPLLYDQKKTVTRSYDVEVNKVIFGKPKTLVQECAFFISEEGIIEKQFKKFHYQTAMNQIMEHLRKRKKK
ncbi:MAG: redoxin domain-containing protein [Coprobacillus sp.]